MKARLFAASILTLLGAAPAHAQCGATLTYTPKHPLVGDTITATISFYLLPSYPNPPGSYGDLLAYLDYSEGYGDFPAQPNGEESGIGGSFQGTFTARQAGSFRIEGYGTPRYHYGVFNPCEANYGEARATVTGLIAPLNPMGRDVSFLNGQYQIAFQGALANGLPTNAVVALGSITADGQGNITGGVEDINGATGTFTDVSMTGSYTMTGGTGTLTLRSRLGEQKLTLAYTPIDPNTAPDRLPRLDFLTTDASLSGLGKLTAYTPGVNTRSDYTLRLHGSAPAGTGVPYLFEPAYLLGHIGWGTPGNGAGDVNGVFALEAPQIGYQARVAESGKVEAVNAATGRYAFTLKGPIGLQQPAQYIGYLDGQGGSTILSLDPAKGAYLLTGEGVR